VQMHLLRAMLWSIAGEEKVQLQISSAALRNDSKRTGNGNNQQG
jgi:hypothetical protein